MLIEIMHDYNLRALDTELSAPRAIHQREWRIATQVARLEHKLSAARGRLAGHIQLTAPGN